MMFLLKTVWKCISSPRLYKIYNDGAPEAIYEPYGIEKWGDRVIVSAKMILNITVYTSPLIWLYVNKRDTCIYEEYRTLMSTIGVISFFLGVAFLMRACGRATSPKYIQFMKAITILPGQTTDAYMTVVRGYDFDFSDWPVSYKMPQTPRASWLSRNPFRTEVNADMPSYQRVPIQILALLATHTFGIRLIYPGSLGIIHNFLWAPLFEGRTNLVETYNGQRAKLQTADGNYLDTMFVDNRFSTHNGKYLVICCEGNSGYYEVGIMNSPIKSGYSALGWNHPGFAESTGLPYPDQEHNAIDAVMQYAINKLNFSPKNIVMFGWSIGGYSAAWAAVNYPVRGLILDATFDDLLSLAYNQMPESWAPLVKEVIRSYVDLNVADLLRSYTGAVQLVRRTDDEIICLSPGVVSSNRGNYLLTEIIKHRHPELATAHEADLVRYAGMLAAQRPAPAGHVHNLLLRTVAHYMKDYKSSHCTPLPHDYFATIMSHVLTNKQI